MIAASNLDELFADCGLAVPSAEELQGLLNRYPSHNDRDEAVGAVRRSGSRRSSRWPSSRGRGAAQAGRDHLLRPDLPAVRELEQPRGDGRRVELGASPPGPIVRAYALTGIVFLNSGRSCARARRSRHPRAHVQHDVRERRERVLEHERARIRGAWHRDGRRRRDEARVVGRIPPAVLGRARPRRRRAATGVAAVAERGVQQRRRRLERTGTATVALSGLTTRRATSA